LKKKLNFIFFIDFNENSGLGHLNRCLHLLRYYKSNHITFVTEKKIRIKGIKNINDKFSDVINQKKIYDIAIIDSYNISTNLEKKIKKISKKTLTIDDLNYRKYNCDYLINYNPSISQNYYSKNLSKKTIPLLGKQYNFIINRENNKQIKTLKSKFNILIYFGTKNRTNLIKTKILKYIFKKISSINKVTILSKFKFKYNDLKISFLDISKKELVLKKIKEADICFLSTGVIVYEALNYNKLIFGKYISDNQKDNYKYLKREKEILPLNKIKDFNFSKKTINNLKVNSFNDSLYKNSIFKLLLEPILDKTGNEIYIEYYRNYYLRDIYKLQNKNFRKNYINSKTFSYKAHTNYFKKMDKNKKLNTFIIKNENNFVGYIKTYDKTVNTEVSIAIKKDYQNKGIATKLLRYLVTNNFFLKKPKAKINKNNISSINAFKKAGFKNLIFFK
jgi:spore coat polysaccharide biosynthesis predicted glycosyltransferase SpsG